MVELDVAIIGAGIGGPAAAIGLARQGHQVTIYERSTSTGGVGYAFRITPNSDLCLKHLGVDTVAGGAVVADAIRAFDLEGNVVREIREEQGSDFRHEGNSVFASRSQLHQQLMNAAREEGVKFIPGRKVLSVDVTETSFTLEGEEKITADLIIAADGIHSAIRSQVVNGPAPKLQPSGASCFRFTVPVARAKEDKTLSDIMTDDFRMFTWSGNKKMILVYPVEFNTVWNVTCLHPSELSKREVSGDKSVPSIDYDQGVPFETVMSIYDDFDVGAKSLLSLADKDGFRAWPLADMEELPNCSQNNVVLLGDACHPVLPSGYSGASMAIEDAVTLATLITPDLHKSDLPDRLRLYEKIRRPRVEMVRDTARENKYGSGDPERQVQYRKKLFSHNAIAHAKDELKAHLNA